jgi:hypothetical protein
LFNATGPERSHDTVGVAAVINGIAACREVFAAIDEK